MRPGAAITYGCFKIHRAAFQRGPIRRQSLVAANEQRTDALRRRWMRHVYRGRRQSPKTRGDFRFAAQCVEGRLIVGDLEFLGRCRDRNQNAIEHRIVGRRLLLSPIESRLMSVNAP